MKKQITFQVASIILLVLLVGQTKSPPFPFGLIAWGIIGGCIAVISVILIPEDNKNEA